MKSVHTFGSCVGVIEGGRFEARTSALKCSSLYRHQRVYQSHSQDFSVCTAHNGVQRLVYYCNATNFKNNNFVAFTRECFVAKEDLQTRECFVAKDDLQTLKAFVKAAGRSHPTMHYAKVSDGLWSVFILKFVKDSSHTCN